MQVIFVTKYSTQEVVRVLFFAINRTKTFLLKENYCLVLITTQLYLYGCHVKKCWDILRLKSYSVLHSIYKNIESSEQMSLSLFFLYHIL